MQRRDFLRAFSSVTAAVTAAAYGPAFALSPEGKAFDDAVKGQPWLKPFKGVTDQDLRCDALALSGRWPAEFHGRFYRNGPALIERDGQRYHHWFAGDGMVQQFSFTGGAQPKVRHIGRLVRTPKLVAEQKAGKFLFGAYGTRIESDEPTQGPDTFNVANTNAIEHAGKVLAMWEGGSAFALSPNDLSTLGPVTWQEGLAQMPFSAHPKLDAKGNLWNFGSAGANLVVWHVDPMGRLVKAQIGESPYPGGMAHDAAMTERYIVLPLPPVKLNFGEDVVAGKAFAYEPNEPLRILVMKKEDIAQRRVFELPSQMVFHVGNAHELADARVRDARRVNAAGRAPGQLRWVEHAACGTRHAQRQGARGGHARHGRVPARAPDAQRPEHALPADRRGLGRKSREATVVPRAAAARRRNRPHAALRLRPRHRGRRAHRRAQARRA
jgi:all-trans-8'-apo-beta-carotenal 15,15'-oxygenase